MARCQALTKKGTQCTIQDAAFDVERQVWACHVHHSGKVFQQQMAATRAERMAKRAQRRGLRAGMRRARKVWSPAETPSLKDRT